MRRFPRNVSAIASVLAMVAGSTAASGASSDTRALALNVIEHGDKIEIEVVANSPILQQVEYEVELTGASHARHKGNTSIAAGDRQVLSRLKTNKVDGWCATVEVSEASGARYTLKAGDCTQM